MAPSSGKLGRGLGELFETESEARPLFASSGRHFTPLFIDRIDALESATPPPDMVESIRAHGLLCPVVVRPTGDRFLATSRGELHPPFANDNPTDKPRNRTVTLRLLASVPED